MIVLVLLGITAWFSFEIGRRWEVGEREEQLERLEEQKERRGRRGTVRLRPLRIRR
jgi:hypothetical protein